ncbi:MAG: 1-phosphofructokinase [Erysipelotrichales bacterium]|nr:1-phosphofructokinase [Erysipelotrichales bacterium]
MIYTITFNPSLDYTISVRGFETGRINRTVHESIFAGGKGINVSMVLRNLGTDSTALGFIAGFTGKEIERRLKEQGIQTDLIEAEEGYSRINVKMKDGKTETEINGAGPVIKEAQIHALYEKLDRLTNEDLLVISGSVPSCLPDDMYERILERLAGKDIPVVVDAAGGLLKKVLPYHPFLVKPNNHELGDIYGVNLKTRKEVIPYAEKMRAQGAQNVLVSMAGEGAVLAAEDGKIYECAAPKGVVRNSIGAGDSMVAGFIEAYLRTGKDYEESLIWGSCTGSASAFSLGLTTKEQAEELRRQFEK